MGPKGTGVNTYTYFVTQDSMSEWIKLPDLTPQELASREIKVLFLATSRGKSTPTHTSSAKRSTT